ncbi:hypothetical protein MKW98_027084 [Papaver atlanticum]|uniref:Uncharacterized protein n=1 Tax=Papaver atlanticum TaxID=357466 RepID=A0AAD4T6V3_9MAGN|nr:hypothetical protein MKW98_027084 [Papaver atlanticum]
MGEHSYPDSDSVISSNHDLLASVTRSIRQAKEAAIHHYGKSFRGFSAILTAEQAQQLRESETVISVFESKVNQLHTTHSWDFLGVDDYPQNNANIESKSDVIVGVIDSGVLPESESFNDNGLGPVQERFKGECIAGDEFTVENCNRKIIGARYYSKGIEQLEGPLESRNITFFRSARDRDGHGTHVASTVAGSVVNDVSLFGIASGTARGGMPGARLAIYKTCWPLCADTDVLAAIDDAISDEVDIISISIDSTPDLFNDAMSIGSFHAFKKGILVSTSAGNSGDFTPEVAPWLLTVSASSIDREFNSNVQLRDSQILKGNSINPLRMDKFHPVIFAEDAASAGVTKGNASSCDKGTLDHNLIKGKIVVCKGGDTEGAEVLRDGGGVGVILLINPLAGLNDYSDQYVIPTTVVDSIELMQALVDYIALSQNPTARISPTTTILNTTPAPKMAVFSSVGPNTVVHDIIKPDITAPGVRILAAWSPVSIESTGGRSVDYNFQSGTSMACPHASGIAAMIKNHHPSWSPSAIKSAIMTTANVMDNTNGPVLESSGDFLATPWNYGSGHVNLTAALDPGLVYEFDYNDMIDFLCATPGANPTKIEMLTGTEITCSNSPHMNGEVSVTRTVTYVGRGPATFKAFTQHPSGVKVSVKPNVIKFKKTGERKSFRVHFMPSETTNNTFIIGSLSWISGLYQVRSPIAVNVDSI